MSRGAPDQVELRRPQRPGGFDRSNHGNQYHTTLSLTLDIVARCPQSFHPDTWTDSDRAIRSVVFDESVPHRRQQKV